ncbi:MAG: DUF3137 domain-containing protein [Henriciella sp.]|nr:DUF3137 domain-containing protein [Henriciella sp.]
MAVQMMDAIFAGLTEKRAEFADAMETWRDHLQPELEKREQERKAIIATARSKTLRNGLIVGGLTLIAAFLLSGMIGFILFAGVAITAVASGVAWVPLFAMKTRTKELVVGSAADAFGFEYRTLHPDVSGISNWRSAGEWIKSRSSASGLAGKNFALHKEDEPPTPAFDTLKAARLMPGYDSRQFEDLIEGERAGAVFSLVECKLTEQQGSGKNRRTVTTFQGLLFHIQYPQRFLGRTLLARQGWWKGWFGDKDLKKVDLVAKELEDNFTIYSNDQVEARALLTPDRMERLIALEQHFKGGKLRGIFEDDHLTLALEAKNQFEAGSVWKPLVNPERYISALNEMGLVCDVIDGFLTRDWVKDRR